MQKSIYLLGFIFILFSCSNEPRKVEHKADIPATEITSIISADLLKKANIQMEQIDLEAFQSIIYLDTLYTIADLCYQSKGYQSQVWQGLNKCEWAIEKERIKNAVGLVSREQETLRINKTGRQLELTNQAKQDDDSVYFQFKNYINDPGFFVIEKSSPSDCDKTMFIHNKKEAEYTLKGNVNFLKDPRRFILYHNSPSNQNCPNKLEYYELQDSLLLKKWHFPLKSKSIEALKIGEDNNIYCAITKQNQPGAPVQYFKINLDE